MGCCVSTDSSPVPRSGSNIKRSSKSPPPTHSLQEEEAVKEVLSETPTIPKRPSPAFVEGGRTETPFIKNAPLLLPAGVLSKPPRNGGVPQKPLVVFGHEEASEEVSEIRSTVRGSVRVSTSVAEKKDNYSRENVVVSKIQKRSPARAGNQSFSGEYKRDRSSGKSPYSNEEIPARRSRYPMMRADSGPVKPIPGRIQIAGESPSRFDTGSGDETRKLEEDNGDHHLPVTSNDLLENPLVSLECFIFL